MIVWCYKCRKKTKGKIIKGSLGNGVVVCSLCGEKDQIKPID